MDKALTLFIETANEPDPLRRAIISRQLAMIMRGQLGEKEPLQNHIIYNHQRRDLFHLFSAKNFGYTYGFKEYSKFLSFKDYLKMPPDLTEDLLEGYARGTEDLLEAKRKAAEKAARENKPSMSEKSALNQALKGNQ